MKKIKVTELHKRMAWKFLKEFCQKNTRPIPKNPKDRVPIVFDSIQACDFLAEVIALVTVRLDQVEEELKQAIIRVNKLGVKKTKIAEAL